MSAYLDHLDALLRAGIQPLPKGFLAHQAEFVQAQQQVDGGFPGREGASDPYYTDFALRTLSLFPANAATMQRTGSYWEHAAPPPNDVVSTFHRLNAARLLSRCGVRISVDPQRLIQILESSRLPNGGFARPPDHRLSASHTFLGLLCLQMLGQELSERHLIVQQVAALQGPNGGFRELAGEGPEQTNATAAAVAVLTLCGALDEETGRRAAGFLARMQAPDGGFCAHPEAPGGDLLSTFTGLLTLLALAPPESEVDLAGIARFVRSVAAPGGGFGGFLGDGGTDIEYTYYGLGTLALLNIRLLAKKERG